MSPLLLCFIAGLASACGFAPLGLWPLTLASVAGLAWLVAKAPSLAQALARGWWFGLGHFMLGLNWIATAFTYQANMPAWLGWVAVLLVSLYLAVFPAAAAGLAWNYGRTDRLRFVLLFAAAWTVTEWLRASLFTGFAWNPLGAVLLDTPLAPLATFVGTYGLSAVALLVAGALLLLSERRWLAGAGVASALAAAVAIVAATGARDPGFAGLEVHVVQPNIGQEDKWVDGAYREHLARLAAYSQDRERVLAPQPGQPAAAKLLLWPEAAITLPLQDGRRDAFFQARARALRDFAGSVLAPGDLLLTGGVTFQSEDGEEVDSATNSIFAIDSAGRILARYDKAHLVPYGEYLPARPLLSAVGLSRLAPGDIDFESGPGPRTIALPIAGKAGFQICYEIIFSGKVVDPRERPSFLFNPSNDAWFGTWGPPQHLAQARLRALEEGLPVLRATPTGISAVIDAKGRLLHSVPWRTAGVIRTGLPAPLAPTLFARLGNILPLAFALLLAATAIAVVRKAR